MILKAYAWVRAMGAEGIAQASDISVLGNNYMEKGLLAIRGVTRSARDDALLARDDEGGNRGQRP